MQRLQDLESAVKLLKEENAALKVLAKRPRSELEEEDPDVIIKAEQPLEVKAERIRAALPVDTNEAFVNIIQDAEGEQILQGILQDAIMDGLEREEFTLDVTVKSRALTNKVLHTLFSMEYVDNLRIYNPRENYEQAPGTAMVKFVYDWLHDTIMTLVAEIFSRENVERVPFEWEKFLDMLRDSWKWCKNNIRKKKQRAAKKARKN